MIDHHWVAEMLVEVRAELNRVEAAIQHLEALQPPPVKRKRGRHAMGEEERQQVSERMTRYWAERRRSDRQRQGCSQ